MKSKYFFGGLFVLLGILWIVGATHFLITDVFPVQLQDPLAWAQQVYFPASSISTVLYLGFLLAWVFYSFNSRFTSSSKAKTTITLWLLLFIAAIVSNIVALVLCIQFITVVGSSTEQFLGGGTFVNIPPYEFLIPLTVVNGLLLFWLPSCFLTQRTLRFIPPLSYELTTTLTGKR